MRTDGDVPAELCVPRHLSRMNPFNMWTYLKHQSEQEHHSNTGNNICMVLDDKLMAQHRRVLVSLLSDPHVGTIIETLALRGADVVILFFFFCFLTAPYR